MATRFEILIHHPDGRYARQSAEAAFAELQRLEGLLSRYIETSDIARLNRAQPGAFVPLSLETFDSLQQCKRIHAETFGAFDPAAGKVIVRIKAGKEVSGIHLEASLDGLELADAPPGAVKLSEEIELDLGGFGKGYALDRMAELLSDWDIDSALLHGGQSTALALAPPPDKGGWPLNIIHPQSGGVYMRLELHNSAFSASGLEKGTHIIDPRNNRAADRILAAWVRHKNAAEADALSTALMIFGNDEREAYLAEHPLPLAMQFTNDSGFQEFSVA